MSTLYMKYRKFIGLLKDKIKPRISAGFIGQGNHATTNLYPSLGYAGIELVATCANHNADYTNYLEMLDKVKMDAVIVCVNARVHYEVALECIKRKLPVFIEKPPAPNTEYAKLLCNTDTFIMVGFNKRFSPVFQEAKRLIPNPIRIIANVCVGGCGDYNNLLKEVGIHYFDLFRYFGITGQLNITDLLSWEQAREHIEIYKNNGLVIIDNGTLTYYQHDKTTVITPNRVVPCKENQLIFTNGYVGELEYFANCVANKKIGDSNINDGYLALKDIEGKCIH